MKNMRTSEKVRELGLYMSDCCGADRIFFKSDTFCRCPKCERLCKWELVESVVLWSDFEVLEHEAA